MDTARHSRIKPCRNVQIAMTSPPSRPKTAPIPSPLDARTFARALETLAARDDDLAQVVARFGPPPMWRRRPGFATLIRIILEQQVSLASAQAVFGRLAAIAVPFSATRYRQISDSQLTAVGLTRQKRACSRALAEAIASRHLQLKTLTAMPDIEARRTLMTIKGIGPWTADIYLLLALRRPDIWPRGDLALNKALIAVKNLHKKSAEADLAAIAAAWQPWRAVAARILWHCYLSIRGKSAPSEF